MNTLSRLLFGIAALTLLGVSLSVPITQAAQPTSPTPPVIPVAHSALLTIDATAVNDGLALHVKHAGNQIPIDGRDVTVSVDGKEQTVTAEPAGTFVISTKELGDGGERQLDITVAHDGIREILTGKITLPKTASATDLLSNHKQLAWWILNIVVVLIAVMAFSRRSSSAAAKESEEDD